MMPPRWMSCAASLHRPTAQRNRPGNGRLGRLRELIGLLVVGLFMIWLFPARLNMWSERVRAHPLRSAGSGS